MSLYRIVATTTASGSSVRYKTRHKWLYEKNEHEADEADVTLQLVSELFVLFVFYNSWNLRSEQHFKAKGFPKW